MADKTPSTTALIKECRIEVMTAHTSGVDALADIMRIAEAALRDASMGRLISPTDRMRRIAAIQRRAAQSMEEMLR